MRYRIAVLAVVASLAGPLHAAPFQNGSFDIGAPTTFVFDIPVGSTTIPGWTVSVGSVDWITNNWVSANGTSSLDLVGSLGVGGVEQTFDTVPGTTYVVAFDLAGNPGAPAVKPLTVTVNGVSRAYTFDTTGRTGAAMGWARQNFTFVATGATSTISFVSDVRGLGGFNNAGAALDNVTISPQGAVVAAPQPVPLPFAHVGAALLVLLGAMGIARRRRR